MFWPSSPVIIVGKALDLQVLRADAPGDDLDEAW